MAFLRTTLTCSTTLTSSATIAEGRGQDEGEAPRAAERVLLFTLDGRAYGCAITTVREIIPARPAARLPGAPAYVCGLVNLRGSLVTVLDLGLRLGKESSVRPDGSFVLVDLGPKIVGLAVEEVRDVRPLADDQIEPASGDAASEGVIRGIAHLGDDVVVLLDVHTLVRQVLL
ncbi:MAG: chemotaxis protein CheW [Gemmatimonadaceae bacterium]